MTESTKSLLDWDDAEDTKASAEDAEFEANFAQAAPVPQACSIDSPDCEACQ